MRAALFLTFVVLTFAVAACAQAPKAKADNGCEAGGGCVTVSRLKLLKALQNAKEIGHEEGKSEGYLAGHEDGKQCWRPA